MTRVILIRADPTPWDVEDRLVGNHPLPLTDLGRATVESAALTFGESISAVYCPKKNEACKQAADIVAKAAKVRVQESAGLEELNLGLWQGITRAELRRRYPKVFQQWEEDALSVNPPDGEQFLEGVGRIHSAMKRILRKQRGISAALVLRPYAMRIAIDLLRGLPPSETASHLHNSPAVETIDLENEDQLRFTK